jgi:hypothetical protein
VQKLLIAVAFGALALGCGGGDDDDNGKGALAGAPLDCAWLAGDNCWKTTVAAAAACVPDASTRGTLSADGKTCAYASGTTVDFATPVTLPLDVANQPAWDFTVTTGGQQCLTYDSTPNSDLALSVGGMTVSEKGAGLALQVTCPDGSQYVAPNAFDLFNCTTTSIFTDGPGDEDSGSDTSVNLALLNGTSMPLSVFDCERAQ